LAIQQLPHDQKKKETTTVVNSIWRRYWLRIPPQKANSSTPCNQISFAMTTTNQPNNMKRYNVFLDDNAADLKCEWIRMDFYPLFYSMYTIVL
jgi:hypothetical protein